MTTFTASDFGRTFTSNGDGTDHGCGAHHFILGGAVRGGDLYGNFPACGVSGAPGRVQQPEPDRQWRHAAYGVDQCAATLGRWFGVLDAQLPDLFPNLANLDGSVRNLGFME